MNIAWTKHIKDPEEKQKFEKDLLSSRIVLNRLSDIIDESEKEISNTETTFKSYDVPNWDYRQADLNGYKRCLKMFKKLVDLDQEKGK